MNFKTAIAAGAALIALSVTTPALAVTTFFTNFDSVAVAPGSFTVLPTVEGWSTTFGPGIELQNHAAGSPFSEPNLVELDSFSNSAMSRLILPGVYHLTGKVSARPGQPASTNGLEILLNNVVQTTDFLDGTALTDTNWLSGNLFFTVFAPTTLTFRAAGTSDSLGIYLDDIGLTGTSVPEPASWAMMLGGFGLVGSAMRRRKVRFAIA
jgi:PEP-CTERM motif